MKKKYYFKLDLLRIIACICILLYHLSILKGGYLFVCTFFVLTAYLSCISSFKKEKFSIKDYYINRLKKIYLPLLIVTFITIFATSFVKNLNWINLKPETSSVIFGYNNYWQLNAKLDYFARHVSSPFMHFWYIGILLQFELLFPLIFTILRKLGDKIHRLLPIIIILIASIISTIIFFNASKSNNIMFTYYATQTRMFSLFYGMLIAFVQNYYSKLKLKILKNKTINKIIYTIYMIILILSTIFIPSTSKLFAIAMILVSIITCRIISYSTAVPDNPNKIINYLSNISYEIYLWQYPVIFLIGYLSIEKNLVTLAIILITILLSMILHFSLSKQKGIILNVLKYLVLVILLVPTLCGVFKYITEKDNTKAMKDLENELSTNAKIVEEKQKQYLENMKKQQTSWEEELSTLENGEEKLGEIVKNLKVVGIGDSVMLGAVPQLYEMFPNGYFDAMKNRSPWQANDLVKDIINKGLLGDVVVINLGTNGDCSQSCKKEVINTIGDKEIFWVNVVNDADVHVNAKLEELTKEIPNVHVVDWAGISAPHPEYFAADKIHLNKPGKIGYAQAIYDSIYQVYLEKYKKEKEEKIKEHEQAQKNRLTFYGNDLLLNSYTNIQNSIENAIYNIDKEYTTQTLIDKIKKDEKENILTNRIILLFDNKATIDYRQIQDVLENKELYIINVTSKKINITKNENTTIIDFYKEIQKNEDYTLIDKIHLSKKGNEALSEIIVKATTKE